jgi:glycosyltransferase involved in cell wall biosynthesis
VRILLVSHPALAAEKGAAQIALNLAAALRARGHEAVAWSPEPLAADTRWWNLRRRQARAAARFAAGSGPWDLVDTPAVTASRELARCGPLVARSVQPELRYVWHGVRNDLLHRPSPRALLHAALAVPLERAIVGGWRRARTILCLGSQEMAWMRRRYPSWRSKLGCYLCAPAAGEQSALAAVRRARRPLAAGGARNFLWIGRWAAHKGTRRLVRFIAERLAAAPEDRFTLAGCGAPADPALAAEWLRSGQVRLVPAFARAELPALLAAHEVGLFTSEAEGWGLTLNEMLEAGLIVYATEAGAVADLRPFFPSSLRPFPPPLSIAAGKPEDLDANGYYQTFSWPAIAAAYERQAADAVMPEEGERPAAVDGRTPRTEARGWAGEDSEGGEAGQASGAVEVCKAGEAGRADTVAEADTAGEVGKAGEVGGGGR